MKKFLISFPPFQSIFFVGVTLGVVVFGQLATSIGRRPSFILALALMAFAPLIAAFSVSFEMYVAFMFILAAGQAGVFQIAFVLVNTAFIIKLVSLF